MNQKRIDAHSILTLLPMWYVPVLAGILAAVVGILRYWRVSLNWVTILFIFLLSVSFLFCVKLLDYRIRFREFADDDHRSVLILSAPMGKPVSIVPQRLLPLINLTSFLLAFLSVTFFVMILLSCQQHFALNILFFCMICLGVGYAGVTHRQNWTWLRDWLFPLFLVVFPTMFLVLCFSAGGSQLMIIGYILPIFLMTLAFLFVHQMAAYDQMAECSSGLFLLLIQKLKFQIHALFFFLFYLSIVLINLAGAPYRLLFPLLITLPTSAMQIILVERIQQGNAPNWKILGWLAYLNMLLLLYSEIFTVWFPVIIRN